MRFFVTKKEYKRASLDVKMQYLLMGIFLSVIGIAGGLLIILAGLFGEDALTESDLIKVEGTVVDYSFERRGRGDDYAVLTLDTYENGFLVRYLSYGTVHELFGDNRNPVASFWISKSKQKRFDTGKSILTYGLNVDGVEIHRLQDELDADSEAKDMFPIIGIVLIALGFLLNQKYFRRLLKDGEKQKLN